MKTYLLADPVRYPRMIVDAKTDADGETHGSKVEGGTSQTIAEGDVVHVPAGVPHQILVAPGVTYSAVVVKVREP